MTILIFKYFDILEKDSFVDIGQWFILGFALTAFIIQY